MFTVQGYIADDGEDRCFVENTAKTMRAAFRLAWELIGGIPGATACIARSDKGSAQIGYLACNWRGELFEAEIGVWNGWCRRVTPLNPQGSIFAGVFAS